MTESDRLKPLAASVASLTVGEVSPDLAARVAALRRPGRPSIGTDTRIGVRLTNAQRATAERIGDGQANRGIRRALDAANLPSQPIGE